MSFKVTIQPSGHTYTVAADETVLGAAIEAGFNLPYGCRNGACGACKGTVLEGNVDHGQYQDHALSAQEIAEGKTLFCCAKPQTDLVIECREVGLNTGIQPRVLPCRVERKVQLAPDVIAMYLKLPANERLQFLPGQYVEFLMKDGGRRAFSLANAPYNDQTLELHLRLIPGGKFTEYVFNEMPEKAILRFEGPFGTFTLREESTKPIIFVAGGTGFAPIRASSACAAPRVQARDGAVLGGVGQAGPLSAGAAAAVGSAASQPDLRAGTVRSQAGRCVGGAYRPGTSGRAG